MVFDFQGIDDMKGPHWRNGLLWENGRLLEMVTWLVVGSETNVFFFWESVPYGVSTG